jgi:hypothetical protein
MLKTKRHNDGSINDILLFMDSLRIMNPIQRNIYDLLIMYNDNELIKYKIFQLVRYHLNNSLLNLASSSEQILTTIFNNIYDFKLVFLDGKYIQCLKLFLIYKIPYFSLINDDKMLDCDELLINTNSTITKTLITLLYFEHVEIISVDNFLELSKLMDMWLIDDCYYLMADFAYESNNMYDVIKDLIEKKNYDDIILMYDIFKKQEDSNKYGILNKMNKSKKVSTKILSLFVNIDGNIFIFNNWNKIFTPQHQLYAIGLNEKYEYLNMANLNVKDAILFLIKIDFKSKFYYDIVSNFVTSPFTPYHIQFGVYDNIYGTFTSKNNIIHIVTSYYPVFSYHEFKKFTTNISKKENNSFKFTNTNMDNPADICIGSKITFGHTIVTSQSLKNHYTITKIIAKYNSHTFEVDTIHHINPAIKYMTYEIVLDKDIIDFDNTFWLLSFKTHDVIL